MLQELRLIQSEETPFHMEHFMVEDSRPHSLSAPSDWARQHQVALGTDHTDPTKPNLLKC